MRLYRQLLNALYWLYLKSAWNRADRRRSGVYGPIEKVTPP